MYKFAEKESDKRLSNWYEFRKNLETALDPFKAVYHFFDQSPKVKVYTDPYDRSTWPTAWELIDENEYCPFNFVLAMGYTLMLTKRFEKSTAKISISIDKLDKTVYYLLYIDDKVCGYSDQGWIPVIDLPTTLIDLKIYPMTP